MNRAPKVRSLRGKFMRALLLVMGSTGLATIAVLALHPHIEATGSIARRFIAAEPLLEEGLSLALAFVDVAGVKAALAAH